MNIALNDVKFSVHKIEEVTNGVQVSIKKSDNGNISMLSKSGETIVFGLEMCEKVLLGLRG